jgi:glyoxylase I family protein
MLPYTYLAAHRKVIFMADELKFKGINHFSIRVTNTQKSREFYITVLGFKWLVDMGGRVLMQKDDIVLALIPPEPGKTAADDRFDEFRVGLDHISFEVKNREAMVEAATLFDQHNIPHGTINDLGEFGMPMYVMSFRDPDNIQLELTAPH